MPPAPRPWPRARLGSLLASVIACVIGAVAAPSPGGAAETYQAISGEGSSWAAAAIDALRVDVRPLGINVSYIPSGSTAGRRYFIQGIVDFAVSDVPFPSEPEDGQPAERPAPGSYAYLPITAGGTSFMYNLKINGERVTNLRLSGENVAKIFTSAITSWDDPALVADNPGLDLPSQGITPVVRSDGAGITSQLTQWMVSQYGSIWQDYCQRSGEAPGCGPTLFYPTVPGMVAQSGDLGVAGYVAQGFAEGAIGYVNYSYSLGARFPVAKVLNKAGFYTGPTPDNVAVSLLKAEVNEDQSSPDYFTQQLDGVYNSTDPRTYELSSYAYAIVPTIERGPFTAAKGTTMGAFFSYALCEGQKQSAFLGYAPMPINLVRAGLDQIRRIPGVAQQDTDVAACKNPTFGPDGTDLLVNSVGLPQACDRQGPTQCTTGTTAPPTTSTTTTSPATTTSTHPSQPFCGGEPATIVGTESDDDLVGTPGGDVIVGLGGNDRIWGLGGTDVICGDAGDDRLIGGSGADRIFGGGGNDSISGDAGADQLSGGVGDDIIRGGRGDDRLDGRNGHDVCRPGAEAGELVSCEVKPDPAPQGTGDNPHPTGTPPGSDVQ